MSIFTYLDGVLVGSSSIRLTWAGEQGYQGLPSAADGTGSQGGIIFDDPTGTLSVTGWQIAKVIEADCTAAPVLFYGTVADRTYRRGPYTQGPGRQIDTTINDHNGFLSLRILGGNGPSRPDETDTQRLDWLINSSGALDGLVYDLGFVTGTGLPFDAANLQGMYPSEVLNDIASHYGQTFFTYWDQAAQKVGLFFDFPASTTFTSTLSISNDLADVSRDADGIVTGSVYPPFKDGELVADPSEVYSRIRYKYTGGVVWVSNATTASTFFPPPLDYRSFQVENDRVGKRTTATTFATRILTADSVERIMVRFTVQLPSTKVGLIQAGMRINLTFTHLPGFETGAWSRIERINIAPTEGNPLLYDVSCECSTTGLTTGIGSGGGSTDPFPSVPPGPATVIQQVSGESNLHLPDPVGSGTTLIWAAAQRGGDILGAWDYLADGYTLCPDGETVEPVGTNTVVIIYKHTDGTQGQDLGSTGAITGVNGTFYEVSGLLTPDQNSEGLTNGSFTLSSGSITAAAGFIVGVSAQGVGGGYDSVANLVSYTLGAGWTEDYDHFTTGGHPTVTNGHRFDAGTYAYTATNDLPSGDAGIAQVVSFIGSGALADPPAPGKPWGPILPNETPNGTTTSFTMPTGYTWAENSLRVYVDRLDQTAAVTAEDGAAGTFTLGFAPKTGELVEVYGTAI